MSTGLVHDDQRASRDLIDQWFRQLDQRRIYQGSREWAVHVTAILNDEDSLWIQIAGDSRSPGSLLLHLRSTASLEQAVTALTLPPPQMASHPTVINTFLPRGVA